MMDNELIVRIDIDTMLLRSLTRRFRDAVDVLKNAMVPVSFGADLAGDPEQEMRARNLMMVRALPCERE